MVRLLKNGFQAAFASWGSLKMGKQSDGGLYSKAATLWAW